MFVKNLKRGYQEGIKAGPVASFLRQKERKKEIGPSIRLKLIYLRVVLHENTDTVYT